MSGYDLAAVDTKHHLIVAHEVTTAGHDRTQLANIGKQAKDALQKEALTVVADKGYFKGEEVVACVENGKGKGGEGGVLDDLLCGAGVSGKLQRW
jgi:transposase